LPHAGVTASGGVVSELSTSQMAPTCSSSRARSEALMSRLVAVRPNVDNRELAERVTRGDLSVVIDQSYPLEAAAEALQRVGDGTAAGKLVIRIAEASPPR
jgi:NADPH:quinone reductase-like Zn-dependent oxidoreductase